MTISKLELDDLKSKARSKDHVAQYNLAKLYKEGKDVEKDLEQYKKWLEISAQNNNSSAQYELGNCYLNGFVVDKDESAAITWFESATKAGNLNASYKLAVFLLNDVIMENDESALSENLVRSETLLRHAANEGHAYAQYQLGMIYKMNLKGLDKDINESLRWLEKSSNNNCLEAQNELAYLYANGSDEVLKPNIEKALFWWNSAAEKGHDESQYNLATLHAKEAIENWKKSAKQGNEKAAYMLNQVSDYEWDK